MPLISGKKAKTAKGRSENIRREKQAHPDMKISQAVAIAYAQGRHKKKRKKKTK